jgi:hypothetical protein
MATCLKTLTVPLKHFNLTTPDSGSQDSYRLNQAQPHRYLPIPATKLPPQGPSSGPHGGANYAADNR